MSCVRFVCVYVCDIKSEYWQKQFHMRQNFSKFHDFLITYSAKETW